MSQTRLVQDNSRSTETPEQDDVDELMQKWVRSLNSFDDNGQRKVIRVASLEDLRVPSLRKESSDGSQS